MIYVLKCGGVIDTKTAIFHYPKSVMFVTRNYKKACSFISKHINVENLCDKFCEMECWKNGEKVYCYDSYKFDSWTSIYDKLTISEIDRDFKNFKLYV